jgi:HEAT repeat protein
VVDSPQSRLRVLLLAGAGLLLCSEVWAHGGQYRGPTASPGAPGLGAPGGGLRGPRGPTTGIGASLGSSTSWQTWWEFNKDPFLRLKEAIQARGPVSGSDDFYMGNGRSGHRDKLDPSPQEKVQKILPALAGALKGTRNRDIITACLVAMAKMGVETDDIQLLPIFRSHLARPDQEIRETATLSMGIAGLAIAEGDLVALLGDTAAGRRLVNRSEVGDRTRTFAAYALGFLARRSLDVEMKERVYRLLSSVMENRNNRSRDLAMATIHGIGLLDPDPERSSREKLLRWQCVDTLWNYYQRDLGKSWQIIQSHVPGAVARLLGRGTGVLHKRIKDSLAEELTGNERRQNSIYQSAVLALGSLSMPGEDHAEDKVYSSALLNYYREGHDQQARYFSLIALGRIAGAGNREALIGIHVAARTATTKPWSAMALGLVGRAALEEGGDNQSVDLGIGSVLHRDFVEVSNPDVRAALAVALGLVGYRDAADDLLQQLSEIQIHDTLAGYLCIGLALMDERRAVAQIRDLASRSVRRPARLQQAAIALGKLGDKEVTGFLQGMLGVESLNLARLSAVAVALGFIGDRRSVDPLIRLLDDDRHLTKLAQAFVAAALGGIGDKDLLPWNTVLALDVNYRARADTLTNGRSGVLDIL